MKIRGKITKDIAKVEIVTRGKENFAVLNWQTGKEKKSTVPEYYFRQLLGDSLEVVG